jgi:hypothetical protein
MNVNANSDALIKFHKAYTTCVEEAVNNFLAMDSKTKAT